MPEAYGFATADHLEDRLIDAQSRVVYLVGSAITVPTRADDPAAPGADDVIAEIRRLYTKPAELERFNNALAAGDPYQAAFLHLQRTRGQDAANAVIRRCVLRARQRSALFPEVHTEVPAGDPGELCRRLEQDIEGWRLSRAVEALGRILARQQQDSRSIVLTSGFDPLVGVSVRKAGGAAITAAFDGDGGFTAIDAQAATTVVHLHGDWFRSDTLHTRLQLDQARPRLAASLGELLHSRTLLVVGYAGHDGVFINSLVEIIRGSIAPIDVLWAFDGEDEAALRAANARLLELLAPGVARGRVNLYKGIDAQAFLPRLARHHTACEVAAAVHDPPVSEDTRRTAPPLPPDPAAATRCTLLVQCVGRPSEMVSFSQDRVTIGREACTILLRDDQVSRTHGEVSHDGTALRYTDLGSTNGTYLRDGRRVFDAELTPGTLLRLGESWITVVDAPTRRADGPERRRRPVNTRPALVGLYAQKDRRFVKASLVHLRSLEPAYTIELLHDGTIMTREEWRMDVQHALLGAAAVLLYVTADLLASEFFESREITRALIKAGRDGAVVLPLIVGHCAAANNRTLARFPPFNAEGPPLATLGRHLQDRELVRLVSELRALGSR
jgi:pSer/pThr/pTyr-binding forkhead associated (FHA) protein